MARARSNLKARLSLGFWMYHLLDKNRLEWALENRTRQEKFREKHLEVSRTPKALPDFQAYGI